MNCVGREAELAALEDGLGRARRGERAVVFVSGEPGIGKTTLVGPSSAGAPDEDPLWVGRGQCVRYQGATEAYAPLLDALGRLLRDRAEGASRIALLERYAPSWHSPMPNVPKL